jgi:hypothetical protein
LVLVSVIEVSDAIEIPIPFPVDDVRHISQCEGKDIIWEAQYLVPYAEVNNADGIGCRPTPCTQGHRPHRQYLNLAVDMEVALLVCGTHEDKCMGLEIILECSPQGTWEGFRVPHSHYVVVRLTVVFPEYSHHASYYEIPDLRTLGDSVEYQILWSGYLVRPADCSTPHVLSSQDFAPFVYGAPTSNANASTSPESSVGRQPTGPGIEDIGVPRSGSSEQGIQDTRYSAAGIYEDESADALPYPDRPLWRGKYCLLLNEDFSVHNRAFIQVCLLDEPFDEDVLGDTDVGIMYVSENNDLRMTTMRWLLTHIRLEGGRLLSEIILFYSENALSDGSDDGLDGVKKNPNRFNVHRKLLRSDNCATTKIHQKTSPKEVRKVNSMRYYAEKCCQTFDWADTVRIQRKFHSGTFAAKCETGYSVLGQLHDLLGSVRNLSLLPIVTSVRMFGTSFMGYRGQPSFCTSLLQRLDQ